MKSIRDIHRDVVIRSECTSREACEMIAQWVGRSEWSVYKWLRKAPDAPMLSYVNSKYSEYLDRLLNRGV